MAQHAPARSTRSGAGRLRAWALAALLGAVGGQLFLAGGSSATGDAHAAQARGQNAPRGGIVNPADQRQAILEELRKINSSLTELKTHMKGKAIDVNVVNLPEQAGLASGGEK